MTKRLLAPLALFLVAIPCVSAQPVTDKMLADPDPADWLMWRRTLNS